MKISRRTALQFGIGSAAGLILGARRSLMADTIAAGGADVPWLAEIQKPPPQLPKDSPTLGAILVDGDGEPISSVSAWEKQRNLIRGQWLDFLGYENLKRPTNIQLKVLDEDRPQGVVRQLVQYEIEPGMPTEAYLLRPAAAGANRPAVAVFHSTVNHSIRQPAGVEGAPEKAFGLKLAQAGCVAFCPRNYLWPTNHKIDAQQEAARFHGRHPGTLGMAKMLLDAVVAIDILVAQPDVDAKRIGAVGHSLGAKEVLYLAALDDRVKVTVSSEGGIGTKFSNWDAPWYLGEGIRDDAFTREHHELLALVAPRPFLLLGGDSADGDRSWPFIEAALPVYKLYGSPARVGLLNHKQGHGVPPEAEKKIYQWFEAYL
jgi:dienelactone hydrolase